MSRDKNFRKLMTSNNDPDRDEILESIKSQINDENNSVSQTGDTLVMSSQTYSRKKLILILGIVILCVVLALSSYFIWRFVSTPKQRYCTINDYYAEDTSVTIKDYAAANKKQIKYIDWYNEIEYFYGQHYKLKTNNEIVCLYEQVVNSDGLFCHLYVTDNLTELDILNMFIMLCKEQIENSVVSLLYGTDTQSSYVMFEYQHYKYYLQAEGIFDQNYILNLVNDLLN